MSRKYSVARAVTVKANVYKSTGQETPEGQFKTLIQQGIKNVRNPDTKYADWYTGGVLSIEIVMNGKEFYFDIPFESQNEKVQRQMNVLAEGYLVPTASAGKDDCSLNDWGMSFLVGREIWATFSWDTEKLDKHGKPFVNVFDIGSTQESLEKKFEPVVIAGIANPFMGKAIGSKVSAKVAIMPAVAITAPTPVGESVNPASSNNDEIPF